MKFSRMLLVAMFVVMSAAVAKADGIPDPHIIINAFPDPPDVVTFSDNSPTDPLIITFFDTNEIFDYTGTATLTELYMELEGPALKSGVYDCSGSVVLSDCVAFYQFPPGIVLLAASVDMPTGFYDITVTPEPSTLLMLAMGIIALLGFRRKFGFSANQA